jgi:hypothetical protein
MKTALGVGIIWGLLFLAFVQVQYIGSVSGSFQYNIASPENIIYAVNTVPLDIYIRTTIGFRSGYDDYVSEIFYCLNGKGNVSVPFELTITGEGSHYNYRALTYLSALSDGDHNVIVYAVGKKYPFVVDSINFAIGYSSITPEPKLTPTPEPVTFPTSLVIASVIPATVVLVGIGLLVYRIKRK